MVQSRMARGPVDARASQAMKGPCAFLSVRFALEHNWFVRCWWNGSDMLTASITVFIGLIFPVYPSYGTLKCEKTKELVVHLEIRHRFQITRQKVCRSYMGQTYFLLFCRHMWGEGTIQGENHRTHYYQWGLWFKYISTGCYTLDNWRHIVKSGLPF